MISNQIGIAGGQIFDLESLISKLEHSYAMKLKLCGCPMPDQCSHDLVVDYFIKEDGGPNGRCKLDEGKVLIDFEGARNQEAVLRAFLNYELRAKTSRCKVCPFAKTCPIKEEIEEDGKRRIASKILISPSNPEEILRQKETVDLLLKSIADEKQRDAFAEHIINGVSHEEIAKRYHSSSSKIRQRFSRERRRLKEKLAGIFDNSLVTRSYSASLAESAAPTNSVDASHVPTLSERARLRRKTRT